nr:protein SirB1 [Raoultella sp. NCTC 9187]
MRSLADFEFNKAPLCDGMVLISELIRDDFPTGYVQDELERLLSLAQEEIATSWDQERQLERLLELFYHEWGFRDSHGVYRLSDALWIDKVLINRQGSAASLGAIVLWIAQRMSLPVVPVIFPTQMLLRADPETSEEMWLINPFNGETLNEHTLEVWLKGNISPVAELFNEDLDEADNAEVIHKLLDTLKSALMEERQMELALRASEALLQFNPEDPYEIRDRGLIYAQLECDHVALLDLNYFVEQCPEDPISEMIRAQIKHDFAQTNYIALVDIREIRCAEAILRYDAYLSGMIPVTP